MNYDPFVKNPLVDVKQAKDSLEAAFDRWGIEAEYEYDEFFGVKCDIYTNVYKDKINLSMSVYPSGLVTYYFYFDYMKKTAENLALVNEFNDCVVGLKASISDIGCLVVCNEAEILNENIIVAYTKSVLDNLVDVGTVQYLLPLTKITHR